MNIIGISAFFHDSACCLLQDGVIKAAAEEERFTRIKADPSLPEYAFKYCLREAGLTIGDIDCIAYYENPRKKLARQLWSGVLAQSPDLLDRADPGHVETQIREILGYDGLIRYAEHHMSHAASSYYFSGFTESAVFTVDGVGEWATTTYGVGSGHELSLFEEVEFPDSLGLLYSTITSYLGFGVNDGEYKVMGLAPYGKPAYVDKIEQLITQHPKGQYRLNMKYFGFLAGDRMYSEHLAALLGKPPRKEDSKLEQFHSDVAKSLQVVLEQIELDKVNYLYERTGSDNLCMAGGVALNCVANGQLLRKGPFKRLFVQPAANDAGCSIGAAALAHVALTGQSPSNGKLAHVYLGPSSTSKQIYSFLLSTPIRYKDCRGDTEGLLAYTAQKLNEGKVIGWFSGRMEFGPRSLGARSILADPRRPEMRDRINAMVKKREGFRPFAPAVLREKAQEHFDLDHDSPYMLETCQVVSSLALPAITHVDGSARVQTVDRETKSRFYDLLAAFEKISGCPILLNTSFNVKGEPIVCTPEDALQCFIKSDIDLLVLEDFIIDREENEFDLFKFMMERMEMREIREGGIRHDVYTFI
jgi:carbamoyltransferase